MTPTDTTTIVVSPDIAVDALAQLLNQTSAARRARHEAGGDDYRQPGDDRDEAELFPRVEEAPE